ncbi:methyl-accepting chemotaxis protein [Paraburkholderia phytofirmans]
MLLAGLTLGAWIAWKLTVSITVPLRDAMYGAERVAAGDLTATTVAASGKDEAAQLLISLQSMTTTLSRVVAGIFASGDAVATGSQQIATGSLDLCYRTEQQAVAIQQTAAAMAALTRTVGQNADSALQGSDLAGIASNIASRGGEDFRRVIEAMNTIVESSTQVAPIVRTIETIASQINILAINAAVEAARAGEHGRGFAVVAREVRELAQRSATASREIKRLIDQSVTNVTRGMTHVDNAGKTMQDIIDAIGRVEELMTSISVASHDQQVSIAQVSQAMQQMDTTTQQNAALVEEAASAARCIAEQANEMRALVSHFRVPSEHNIR